MPLRRAPAGASHKAHLLGPHPIIRHYLERMNFTGIIQGCLGAGFRQGLDDAQVLSVMVHNVLVSRGPLYRVLEWAQRLDPAALGLTSQQVAGLNDDRIARSLDALASERGRSVFFRLTLRVLKHFNVAVPRVHFDTTTVTFSGEYDGSSSEPRITYGHNKDHRPDLKQLVLGLNVSSDGAVPLLHHVFSGNRTDDTVHVMNLDHLRSLLGTDAFTYVADSKLCTTTNLEHVSQGGGRFVTVMPRTRREDKMFREQLRADKPAVRWRKFHQMPNARREQDPPDIFSGTDAGPQESAEGYRIVWVRSSQKARVDKHLRDERVRRAEVELELLASRVGGRGLTQRGVVETRIAKILASHQATGFLEAEVITFTETLTRHLHRGRPRSGDSVITERRAHLRLRIKRHPAALRAEARTDGVFPLLTNITDRSRREVLDIYKYQPHLEKRFSLTKSEYAIAPIFLKKPLRVVGLIHVYFIAIMLSALLEREVRLAMKRKDIKRIAVLPEGRSSETPTTPRVLENFLDVGWYEVEQKGTAINFPVELTKNQELLLTLADVPHSLYR